MKSATVKDFSFILTGLLTQYDQKESMREMRRGGGSNIYRLGILLKEAQEAQGEAASAGLLNRDDAEAIEMYRGILQEHFIYERGQFALSALRQLDKKMIAWVQSGKLPTYGKLRDNPGWARVFG